MTTDLSSLLLNKFRMKQSMIHQDLAFDYLELKISVDDSSEAINSAQTAIFQYLTKVLLLYEENEIGKYKTEEYKYVSDQLMNLLLFLKKDHAKKGAPNFMTVNLYRLLGRDLSASYYTLLQETDTKFSSKLSNAVNTLTEVFIRGGNKISMHGNWYNCFKHGAVIILQFLFERFNGFLNSYKEEMLTALYKHLVKCYDNYNTAVEDHIFRANYVSDMMKLINVILSNDNNSNTLNEKLLTRLFKLCKNILSQDSNDHPIFPVPSLIQAVDITSILLKSDRYLSGISSKKARSRPDYFLITSSKYLERTISCFKTDHKELKLIVAKNLADILTFNYIKFGVNLRNPRGALKCCLSFITDRYTHINSGDNIQIGMVQTLVQFIAQLNLAYKTGYISVSDSEPANFVASESLQILTEIYDQIFDMTLLNLTRDSSLKEHQFISDKTTEETGFRTLRDLNAFYRCFLQEVGDDADELVILGHLFFKESNLAKSETLSSRTLFTPLCEFKSSKKTYYYWLTLLEFAQLIIEHIGEYLYKHLEDTGETHDNLGTQLAQQLFVLSHCGIPALQWKASEILIQVLQIQPELSHQLIGRAVSEVTSILEVKGNKSTISFEESLGFAFFTASVLTYCRTSSFSPDMDLRIFTLCQGYLKKYASSDFSRGHVGNASSQTMSDTDYQKQVTSWILLSGLFNYGAKEKYQENIFWIDSTQILQIWKSILGRSLPDWIARDAIADGQSNINYVMEIIKIVEIKTYALTCLSSYIDFAIKCHFGQDKNMPEGILSPELTKNINKMLIHSFSFVKGLFNMFKEAKICLPERLKSSLLTNQVRIYTVLIKIIPYLNVKTDLSSAMFLQVVDDFAGLDPNIFDDGVYQSFLKAKGQQIDQKYDIYETCDGLCYGLTSKFDNFSVQTIKINSISKVYAGIVRGNTTGDIDTSMHLKPVSIFDEYTESWSSRRNSHNLANDYMFLLSNAGRAQGYTNVEKYPVRHEIILVDLAIEIFSLIFPSLSTKVQQSIIENIRSSALLNNNKKGNNRDRVIRTAAADTYYFSRKQAIMINSAIAIYDALSYAIQKNVSDSIISVAVLEPLSRTLKDFDNEDSYLSEINSRSIGLIAALTRRIDTGEKLQSIISSTMRSIIEDKNPLIRAFDVKSLTEIISSSKIPCSPQALQILMMLCIDPHPVVHSASMDALSIIISSQSPTNLSLSYIWKTLDVLAKVWIDDRFGISSPTTVCCNMNCRDYLCSEVLVGKVIRKVVGFSGPLISTWSLEHKTLLKNLIIALLYLNEDHVLAVSREMLKCLEELVVFDRTLFLGSVHLHYLEFLLQNSFAIGIYNGSLTCMPLEASGEELRIGTLYPVTTSVRIRGMCLEYLQQFLKIHSDILKLPSRIEDLLWICLETKDGCLQSWNILRSLIGQSGSDKAEWVAKLVDYFDSKKFDLWKIVLDTFKIRIESDGTIPRITISQITEDTGNVQKGDDSSHNNGQTPRKYSEESDDIFEGNQEALNVNTDGAENSEKTKSSGLKGDLNTKTLSLNPFSLKLADTDWEFRLRIILMLNETLEYARRDTTLRNKLARKISDLVRISFIGTTSGMPTLRLASLKLLQNLIDIYANVKDPATKNESLLCQQQAQIIAAISPAFEEGSNADIVSEAILLLSKLITTGVTPVTRVGRVLQILTSALENMAINNSFTSSTGENIIKIGKLQIRTQNSKEKVWYYLLQSWAYIKTEGNKGDTALTALVHKYNNILVPLWFYSLRNYAIKKYGGRDFNSKNEVRGIFNNHCWISILKASTQTVAENPKKFLDLMGDESANFVLVVLAQCIETLIRLSSSNRVGDDQLEIIIIRSLDELFSLDIALTILFKRLVFGEFIDLFDRLIFVSSYNVKLEIIRLSKTIFESYFKREETSSSTGREVSNDVDELFELIRLNILHITNILPFLKDGKVTHDHVEMTDSDIKLLKESFDTVVEMAQFLPEVMQIDVLSCTLYMLTLIYKFRNKKIISTLLPSLKRILSNFAVVDQENINVMNFFTTINDQLEINDNDSLITILILVSTINNMTLRENDFDDISRFLITGLKSEDASIVALTTRTINILIKERNSPSREILLSKLIPEIINVIGSEVNEIQEPRLMVEILVAFIRRLSKNDNRLLTAYSVFIPVMLWFSTIDDNKFRSYVRDKLHELMKISPEVFKKYVVGVSERRKIQIGDLMKYLPQGITSNKNDDESKTTLQEPEDQPHISLIKFE